MNTQKLEHSQPPQLPSPANPSQCNKPLLSKKQVEQFKKRQEQYQHQQELLQAIEDDSNQMPGWKRAMMRLGRYQYPEVLEGGRDD